jgi:hypothetical protein
MPRPKWRALCPFVSLCLDVFVAEQPVQKSAQKGAFLFIFANFLHFLQGVFQFCALFCAFLTIFYLPILPMPHNLTNQPSFLPKNQHAPKIISRKNPVFS